ncbi:pilus assembly protein CpaC [Photobacterium aquae]|uniref:Pilus assembly protein CpaC n=1 Tax=Photobacterium aquae TaxID=1195763 RepID=A0A0J1GXJ4_9GAMM|nr:pilus assembly protein N-terminal domain-containing protein [Photobacterium aquae]KLV04164.1 pilus assembly protein CpaC [Photobacterium aquae]
MLLRIVLLVMCIVAPLTVHAGDRYITLNDAQDIHLQQDIEKVFISAPTVADYQVIDKHTLVVFAKSVGQARLIAYGNDGQVLLSQRIWVDLDLTQIRRQLQLHFPNLAIKLESVGEQVAVSGTVYSEQERDDVYRTVATLLKRAKTERYEKTDKLEFQDSGMEEPESMIFARNNTWEGIIEQLKVASVQQVNVKISVAQVSETFAKTLGTDWSTLGASVGQFAFARFKPADLSTLITALADDSMAQILAEPNLTVLSGESASFLVGGEVPVIVTSNNNVNITFKEFGIKLDLTAKVMSNEKIRMQLAPEVSDVTKYIKTAGMEVPQLATRKAMTTVELADGESFVLGGLMSSNDLEQLQKVPLIGDLPILGAAFRKSVTERKKTELLIVATVNLVKPVSPEAIQLPYIKKTSTLSRLFNVRNTSKGDQADALAIDLLSRGGFIE